jgi:hypothetical protein
MAAGHATLVEQAMAEHSQALAALRAELDKRGGRGSRGNAAGRIGVGGGGGDFGSEGSSSFVRRATVGAGNSRQQQATAAAVGAQQRLERSKWRLKRLGLAEERSQLWQVRVCVMSACVILFNDCCSYT